MINLAKQLFFTEEKKETYKLIEAILEKYEYCKQIIKYHFKKSLTMPVEDEKRFQPSNKCWICNKLFTEEDKKVRVKVKVSHDLRLSKKVPIIFYNLRGYDDSHLIMQESEKFDAEISVIPNGLEKYMAVIINKSLFFFVIIFN